MIASDQPIPTGEGNPQPPPGPPHDGPGGGFLSPPPRRGGAPLILNSGTLLDPDRRREQALATLRAAKREFFRQGRSDHYARIQRCISQAKVKLGRCLCCRGARLTLEGDCSRRDCPICKELYPAKKARLFRGLLSGAEHLGHYVVTLPHSRSKRVKPQDATSILRSVGRGLEDCWGSIMPAGFSCLHWTGDENPQRPHVHVHSIWSSWGVSGGELVRMPGPMLSLALEKKILDIVGGALRVRNDKRNGEYSFREGEAKQAHVIRYALRPQGCGDPVSLVRFTLPRIQTLRGFGMLATGRRAEWLRLTEGIRKTETETEDDTRTPQEYFEKPDEACSCRGGRTEDLFVVG